MAIRDLIPWNRSRDVTARRTEDQNPFLTLHREMNRLFDDVFRGFDLAPFGSRMADQGMSGQGLGWPNIEISETAGEVTVTAELPGLAEKDVDVQLADGVLIIRGEKKSESEDRDRLFSERYYGRFERRIPVDGVDEEKVSASFKHGLLTVKLPRTETQLANVRRITINGK
jgi:HSP20 family protein